MRRIDRQSFLKGVVLLPGLAGLLTSAASADSSKSSQASMHYQTTPNGGKQCSGCQFFIPAQDPKAEGSCKVVDGSISPNGYCIAYTAK